MSPGRNRGLRQAAKWECCAAVNKIANVENVVCSGETMSRHPELYHYTKAAAFEGIVGSQTLWCSHYREMLDADEIRLMRKLLPQGRRPANGCDCAEAQSENAPALGRLRRG
jgi:hypothetical protein